MLPTILAALALLAALAALCGLAECHRTIVRLHVERDREIAALRERLHVLALSARAPAPREDDDDAMPGARSPLFGREVQQQ